MLLDALPAELVRVVDGDTMVLRVDLGFGVSKEITCRVLGLDTPETRRIKRKGEQVTEGEVKRGIAAKEHAKTLLTGARLWIHVPEGRREKGVYGRWLVELWFELDAKAVLFADAMRAEGHVR